MNTVIVGERGQITIPEALRKKYGIKRRQPVILEERDGELVIKPAAAIPLKHLKIMLREFDDEYIKKLINEDTIKEGEKEKILNKWSK